MAGKQFSTIFGTASRLGGTNERETHEERTAMTKSKKSLIVGAALAGLLASGGAVQASNLLTDAKAGFNATQDKDKDAKPDTKATKDKHACKGQNSCKGNGGCKSSDNGCKGKNSCKGKGGCRTDGKKMEEPKPPAA
jgi:hypothetical protein